MKFQPFSVQTVDRGGAGAIYHDKWGARIARLGGSIDGEASQNIHELGRRVYDKWSCTRNVEVDCTRCAKRIVLFDGSLKRTTRSIPADAVSRAGIGTGTGVCHHQPGKNGDADGSIVVAQVGV